jgi:hypothetical protein
MKGNYGDLADEEKENIYVGIDKEYHEATMELLLQVRKTCSLLMTRPCAGQKRQQIWS